MEDSRKTWSIEYGQGLLYNRVILSDTHITIESLRIILKQIEFYYITIDPKYITN